MEATAEPKYRLMPREMPPDERPREKMLLRGPLALTDGYLLAIMLNTGMVRTGRHAAGRLALHQRRSAAGACRRLGQLHSDARGG